MPTVLLVEDNELSRDMLSRRLRRRGYTVHLALDGVEGVRLARQLHPQIILMDMSLPLLDGWGATRMLKAGDDTRSIPIVALTSHAMLDDRRRCLEAGCDEYETKPVELTRLTEKMDRLLEPSAGRGGAVGVRMEGKEGHPWLR